MGWRLQSVIDHKDKEMEERQKQKLSYQHNWRSNSASPINRNQNSQFSGFQNHIGQSESVSVAPKQHSAFQSVTRTTGHHCNQTGTHQRPTRVGLFWACNNLTTKKTLGFL